MARACYWIVSVSRRTIRQRAGIPGGGDASPANPVRNPASGRPLQILDPDLPEFERSLESTRGSTHDELELARDDERMASFGPGAVKDNKMNSAHSTFGKFTVRAARQSALRSA